MLYAKHNPATYDLTGLSERQFLAVRDGLIMLIDAKRMDNRELSSSECERLRLLHVAALELVDVTNQAMLPQKDDA